MKIKSILTGMAVIFALLSSAAHAADDFWEHTRLGYTIYFSGGYATTPFNPPSSVPRRDAEITDVSWDWNTIPGIKQIPIFNFENKTDTHL